MKCPHCLHNFHDREEYKYLSDDTDGHWSVKILKCSGCDRAVFHLMQSEDWHRGEPRGDQRESLIRPRGSSRPPCPKDVTPEIAEDYLEACLVLPDSAKASAALSRRCLQTLLRTVTKAKHGNLADEIQYGLDNEKWPTTLADSVDAIRNIGNFAAHPMKSQNSGLILPIEPQEAEWTLDVLESLFDHYFVQPAILGAKRAALNAKLAAAGKPPMK